MIPNNEWLETATTAPTMFTDLTKLELNVLWNKLKGCPARMLEVYYINDYGDGVKHDVGNIFWEVAVEIDARENE